MRTATLANRTRDLYAGAAICLYRRQSSIANSIGSTADKMHRQLEGVKLDSWVRDDLEKERRKWQEALAEHRS
jgi:hypothetical protein